MREKKVKQERRLKFVRWSLVGTMMPANFRVELADVSDDWNSGAVYGVTS